MSTCGQQSPDLVDWDRNLGKKWYQISSKKLSPFLVGHLLDFWPHNNNLLFVPQGFEKLHRSSPLRLIARDIGKKLFYRVLGNVTQKKKSPYGDLCNITIPFGRPDWARNQNPIAQFFFKKEAILGLHKNLFWHISRKIGKILENFQKTKFKA